MLNRSLDDIIEAQGNGGGRAPRQGNASTSQRAQPYGGNGGGGGGPRRAPRGDAHMDDGSGNAGGQHFPQQPPRPLISESLDESATPQNAIRVGGGQEAKEIAGRIVDSCRAGDSPALLTIGGPSINQAVKAIAIARSVLEKDGLNITFQPAFRHSDRTKPLIAFYVAQQRIVAQRNAPGQEEVTLTVAGHSKITPIAGAIAGKVRENLLTSLVAIGVDAVTNAVLAIGNARLYLEQDNCDLRVAPDFEKVDKGGTQMTALRLTLQPEQL